MEIPIEILVSVAGGTPHAVSDGYVTIQGTGQTLTIDGGELRAAIAALLDETATAMREVTDKDIEEAQ